MHDRDPDRLRERLGARSIVLVGMMGCGKTSVGRQLAARLKIPFVDADHEIEEAANLTVPEIFARHGEDYFRAGERRVIARLLGQPPRVLATGGGAFMNAQTRANIAERGVSVWLKGDFETLFARVSRRTSRPLLQNPDPEGVMRKLLAERDPVYAQADVTVISRDVPHEVIVDEILAGLDDYFAAHPEAGPAI
ncbi:shikimate kinase [Breoghania sp. L-A4]|uniref:shikimate kinase n=1 Tax=Breoghania sp. L-A4 TaxID=2304600 RepID=UPI000E35CF26|nr:shikimate kinase [Breoghania sp. L-A4]AXS42290.1 shikimate kinase [Breoghania sp. L-A4]